MVQEGREVIEKRRNEQNETKEIHPTRREPGACIKEANEEPMQTAGAWNGVCSRMAEAAVGRNGGAESGRFAAKPRNGKINAAENQNAGERV